MLKVHPRRADMNALFRAGVRSRRPGNSTRALALVIIAWKKKHRKRFRER
jgi:hypothetical protein